MIVITTFKINDLFGRQVVLKPRVELYSVRDFMGQEMPGLAIVLDQVNSKMEYDGQYAVLTVSFGEFIGVKTAHILTPTIAILHSSFWYKGLPRIPGYQKTAAFVDIPSGTSKKIF